MSEYWKSQAKKFCDYCKIWITDNKPSISIHESGKKHQENVRAKLGDIAKRAEQKRAEDKASKQTMAAIEQAAMKAMQSDIDSNPSLAKQYGYKSKSEFNENVNIPTTSELSGPEVKVKQAENKPKVTEDKSASKRKLETPEGKMGKWEENKVKKTMADIKPVDLQLPGKYDKSQSYLAAMTGIEVKKEEKIIEKPKSPPKFVNKWVTVGEELSETPADQSQPNTVKIEAQPVEIVDHAEKTSIVAELNPIKVENPISTEQEPIAEKVVVLKTSGKKEKVVEFKKRKNDSIKLRQKSDE